MATVIQIDDKSDRVRALDILADAGETYHCAPGNRFIVSNRIPRLLREDNVRFKVLEKPRGEMAQGAQDATNA